MTKTKEQKVKTLRRVAWDDEPIDTSVKVALFLLSNVIRKDLDKKIRESTADILTFVLEQGYCEGVDLFNIIPKELICPWDARFHRSKKCDKLSADFEKEQKSKTEDLIIVCTHCGRNTLSGRKCESQNGEHFLLCIKCSENPEVIEKFNLKKFVSKLS